jgi:hypothetical protein
MHATVCACAHVRWQIVKGGDRKEISEWRVGLRAFFTRFGARALALHASERTAAHTHSP